MSNSITQHGITITWTSDAVVGQYANGDYYVVGAVSITSISVASGGRNAGSVAGRDGAMINPSPGTNGYDARSSAAYDAILDKVASGFPFTLSPGESLVCSESALTPRQYSAGNNIYLETAIVLTCVASAPTTNSFRPHFSSSAKRQFAWSDVDTNVLPAVATVSGAPTMATAQGLIQRVQLDQVSGLTGRNLHPYSNLPDYGTDICANWGKCLLMAMIDTGNVGDNTTLLKYLVQLGIDLEGLRQSGMSWYADGGHNQGRKAPILFAGKLLGDSVMQSVGFAPSIFQEDGSTFYISQADVDRALLVKLTGTAQAGSSNSITLAASVPDTNDYQLAGLAITTTGGTGSGQTKTITSYNYKTRVAVVPWTSPVSSDTTYSVAGYVSADKGRAEWGLRHFSLPTRDNPSSQASYRTLNAPWWYGHALSMAMLDLVSAWGNDAYFDYLDDLASASGTFEENMRSTYWGLNYSPPSPAPRLAVRAVPA